jgi:hypothetical protein
MPGCPQHDDLDVLGPCGPDREHSKRREEPVSEMEHDRQEDAAPRQANTNA